MELETEEAKIQRSANCREVKYHKESGMEMKRMLLQQLQNIYDFTQCSYDLCLTCCKELRWSFAGNGRS
ncbi:hypothetical protein Leryth_025359 [Lithospermum erythrorhizon]|nr:hypothetical protein Leryth_025359 [Lithospermum erythrorhizon]